MTVERRPRVASSHRHTQRRRQVSATGYWVTGLDRLTNIQPLRVCSRIIGVTEAHNESVVNWVEKCG
jgi:hypothetical protein